MLVGFEMAKQDVVRWKEQIHFKLEITTYNRTIVCANLLTSIYMF